MGVAALFGLVGGFVRLCMEWDRSMGVGVAVGTLVGGAAMGAAVMGLFADAFTPTRLLIGALVGGVLGYDGLKRAARALASKIERRLEGE